MSEHTAEKDAAVERVKALVDAWSDPDWSGRDAAAPFVRALRNALDYPAPTRVTPPAKGSDLPRGVEAVITKSPKV